jgi:thioredoxin reductase (NADPH)
MSTELTHDVVVVGGGAAGLSAAVTLARSLRDVVVVDGGEPRNAPAAGAHNVLGREGTSPLELLAAGRREAQSYGAVIRDGRVVAARRDDDGFELELADGVTLRSRRLLLATGLVDELPDVPGIREFWGKSVLHCPYCHGWEVRGQRIGVLATSPLSFHQALLFRQLSDDVTVVLHGLPGFADEEQEQLDALGVRIVEGMAERLVGENGMLRAVVVDGRELALDALAVGPRFVAQADVYEQLGGSLTEHPTGLHVATDELGRTDVPGMWAAGNVTDLSATVAASAAAGVFTAAAINMDLVAEDAAAAAAAVRAQAAVRRAG